MGMVNTHFDDLIIVKYSTEKNVAIHDVSNTYGKHIYFRGIMRLYVPREKKYGTYSFLFEAKDGAAERILRMKLRIGSHVNLFADLIPGKDGTVYYTVNQINYTGSGKPKEAQSEKIEKNPVATENPSKAEKDEKKEIESKDEQEEDSSNLDINDAFISNAYASDGLFYGMEELI